MTLQERIEAAEGPSRELDREVAELMGTVKRVQYTRNGPDEFQFPAYTSSMDAAMTLVPEGWRLRQMNFSAPCADCRKWTLNLHGGDVGQDTFHTEAATPALALCAAALKARKADNG